MHSIYLLAILETTNCLSLRNNAACCIPLRDLRDLRENNHISILNLSTKTPQRLPQISLILADNHTLICNHLRNKL